MKKSVVVVSCSLALLLASCGSGSSSSRGDATTPATATTSTAAPASTSSLAATTSSSTASMEGPDATLATLPTTTVAPTTDSTEATLDTTGSTTGGSTDSTESPDTTDAGGTAVSGGEYAPVEAPVVPASTKPVSADSSHADGIYYASVSEGSDPAQPAGSVVFEIVQLFTGAACTAHFGDEDEDACVNDYGVETDPTAHVEVALDQQFISVVDAATQQSYRISGGELYSLLHGDEPAEGAPADYLYSGFGFLVTYRGGEITRLEQWWTP